MAQPRRPRRRGSPPNTTETTDESKSSSATTDKPVTSKPSSPKPRPRATATPSRTRSDSTTHEKKATRTSGVERVAQVTRTIVEEFDPEQIGAYRGLLDPIHTEAGSIDMGQVSRRIDALMSACDWAYRGKIWARQHHHAWDVEKRSYEEEALSEARADKGCTLGKAKPRVDWLKWCAHHQDGRRDELDRISKMRSELEDAVKYYERMYNQFELHRRSMDALLSASNNRRS